MGRINTANLRELESFVAQDTHLFHDSIRNNLVLCESSHEYRAGNIPYIGAVGDTVPSIGSLALVGVADDQRRGVDVFPNRDELGGTIPHLVPAPHVDFWRGETLYRVKYAQRGPEVVQHPLRHGYDHLTRPGPVRAGGGVVAQAVEGIRVFFALADEHGPGQFPGYVKGGGRSAPSFRPGVPALVKPTAKL